MSAREPLKTKPHIVTDAVTTLEYIVRAKTCAGAIAAVARTRRYTARQATADDILNRRDLEVIDADEPDDDGPQGSLLG